jgi:hypothetical protein
MTNNAMTVPPMNTIGIQISGQRYTSRSVVSLGGKAVVFAQIVAAP